MKIKPNIFNAFGPFTRRGFNKIAKSANNTPDVGIIASKQLNDNNRPYTFIAQIGAHSSIGTDIWAYGWYYVTPSVSVGLWVVGDAGPAGALNGCEGYAGGTYYPGLDTTYLATYTNFAIAPITAGTKVLMLATSDANGAVRYVFSVPNGVTGTCPY